MGFYFLINRKSNKKSPVFHVFNIRKYIMKNNKNMNKTSNDSNKREMCIHGRNNKDYKKNILFEIQTHFFMIL